MLKQFIVIQVTVVTELAKRVSSVAGIIWVSVCSVTCKFLTIVPLALMGEDLWERKSLEFDFICLYMVQLPLRSTKKILTIWNINPGFNEPNLNMRILKVLLYVAKM